MDSLFVISSPSGGGKTSLVSAILHRDPRFARPITHTTRAPRPGETNGIDYHFVSVDEFSVLAKSGQLLEMASVHDNFYGTSKAAVANLVEQGKRPLLIIDWKGAATVKTLMPRCTTIFLMPPSLDELERRLIARGQDSQEVIARRVKDAAVDVTKAEMFDFVVTNVDLAGAVDQVMKIIDRKLLQAY